MYQRLSQIRKLTRPIRRPRRLILRAAGSVRRTLMPNAQSKYIVNCGGHKSKFVEVLRDRYDPFGDAIVHTFEPNPVFAPDYRELKRHVFHPEAIWTYDGEIDFYLQDNDFGKGHSVLAEKSNVRGDKSISVKCIDFSAWLERTFSDEDHVIVRMDIEGAEYDVLERIIDSGAIRRISFLMVEFHHETYPQLASEKRFNSIISRIKIPFEQIPN